MNQSASLWSSCLKGIKKQAFVNAIKEIVESSHIIVEIQGERKWLLDGIY